VGGVHPGGAGVRSAASWALFAAYVVIAALTLAVVALGGGDAEDGFLVAALVGFAVVGRVVTARRPGNPVGWILAGIAVAFGAQGLSEGYVASASPGDSLFALELVGWFSDWVWYVWLVLVAIALPLLFPDGKLPSLRWRPVAWAGVAGAVGGVLANALKPGALDVDAEVPLDNPLGIAGAGDVLSVVDAVSLALALAGFVGAGAAVVVRLRRSRGIERQQVKWFAYVAGTMVAGLLLAAASAAFEDDHSWAELTGAIGWMSALLLMAVGIPVATGVAVLRHRLYDIDVVINRTLVYGALTATLAATYVGLVLVLQLALSPGSDLAIAASTLAVAALFRPARARIQGAVDRRFYRRKYDAARTIEAFAARLRDEVDLSALDAELRAVVASTVQPVHVSLWLRKGDAA
jgi:hypothetical protein